jgi:hypothetical protein
MNNIIKTRLLTSIVFTTVIAIGLFGISTTSMVENIFADKDKEGKNNNIMENTATSDSSKDTNEKCTPWDPRGC